MQKFRLQLRVLGNWIGCFAQIFVNIEIDYKSVWLIKKRAQTNIDAKINRKVKKYIETCHHRSGGKQLFKIDHSTQTKGQICCVSYTNCGGN